MEFASDDREAAERGRFAAQHVWSEGNRLGMGGQDPFLFGRGEIALGANPNTQACGWTALLLEEIRKNSPRDLRLGDQACQEGEVEGFLPNQPSVQADRWIDAGQPGIAGLLKGFPGNGLPLGEFVVGFVLQVGYGSFGEQRHDARSSKLGGLLNDPLHGFSLGHSLDQGDGAPRRRKDPDFHHPELNALAAAVDGLTLDLSAGAVEDHRPVTRADPEHVEGVVRLVIIQDQLGSLALFRGQVEPMH